MAWHQRRGFMEKAGERGERFFRGEGKLRAFQAERATHAEAQGQESARYVQELPAV